ncbi:hypothetical protein ACLM45_07115 [Synechococcus sp. A10-1-5-9]|uniref:hypothetical protein n=1 Tax=Synechococcus sp. A10-1-5-9 TaxID=3392295 RepID=UPI0039E772FC
MNRSTDDLLLILGFSAPPGLYEPIFIGGWLDQNLQEALKATPGVGDIRVFGSSELRFPTLA